MEVRSFWNLSVYSRNWQLMIPKIKITYLRKSELRCAWDFNKSYSNGRQPTTLFDHRKPILYVCLIGFLWYHGVERNISKCMGWNQLWRYLGEYWNKLNFTCLICSWSLSWSLVAISPSLPPTKTRWNGLKSLPEIKKDSNYKWGK